MARNATRHRIMEKTVADELNGLPELTRAELIVRWADAYGRPTPKGISRRLLEYSAAYAIQVRASGGLTRSVRKEIERGHDKTKVAGQRQTLSRETLPVGARLVRDWHGSTHTVDVVEGGYRYAGREFGSLSEIARKITGARWSGPRFFGI